jgi:glycosyltransferase involved in cell wall biosynthesis
MLRVLRIISRLSVGGSARQAVLLDAGLRDRGCETLLVYGPRPAHEGSLEELVTTYGVPALRVESFRRRIAPVRDVLTCISLLRLLFKVRPDIVHTHAAKAGVLGRATAAIYNLTRPRARRCAVVHTFHGNVLQGYFGPATSGLIRMVERSMAKITDRIVTVSAQQRMEITERFRIAQPSKVQVVPVGHDLERLRSLPSVRRPSARDAEDDRIVIGFVGRFVAIKDLPALIEAFAIVHAQYPHARLLLAGDGEERAALEQLAADRGVAAHTRFVGWTTDLPSLYAELDILVLPSLNEGMPASLIEGMAAGCAVVATAVGGVPELVEAGRTGLLVPPGQPRQLAAALLQLVGDASRRRTLGEAARAAVVSRFAPGQLVAETFRLYEDAVHARRGANGSAPLTRAAAPATQLHGAPRHD